MSPYAQEAISRLRLDPREPDALFTRAAFLARRGDADTAVTILNRLADVDPDYPGVWRFLARLYSDLGEDHLAGLCIERAGMSA